MVPCKKSKTKTVLLYTYLVYIFRRIKKIKKVYVPPGQPKQQNNFTPHRAAQERHTVWYNTNLSYFSSLTTRILLDPKHTDRHQGSSIKDVGIFQGEGGLKFRCCKKSEGRSSVNQGQNSDMGEGGIKNGQNNSDVFYGRPLKVIVDRFYGKLSLLV